MSTFIRACTSALRSAAAVFQPGIDPGVRFVHPPADAADDLVDGAQKTALVAEADLAFLQHTEALDIDVAVRVHQDVVDRRVCEQWLQRAETQHLVQKLVHAHLERLGPHRIAFLVQHLRDQRRDPAPQFLGLDLVDDGKVEPVEQDIVQVAVQLQPRQKLAVLRVRFGLERLRARLFRPEIDDVRS
jgi:hypothetical protein